MKLVELLEQMIEARESMHVNAMMLNKWISELAKHIGEEEE